MVRGEDGGERVVEVDVTVGGVDGAEDAAEVEVGGCGGYAELTDCGVEVGELVDG